jgi:excisionase family DNA binding protein
MGNKVNFDAGSEYCGTSYAAKMLDLSVGTVQSLVEKNELLAWKTQGGHRRISIQSVRDFQRRNNYINKSHLTTGQRLKVMVVEDEDLTRQMLSDHFQQWDLPLDPSYFSSALMALLDWPHFQPQVLITDLRMPGLDGFELIRTLHSHPRYGQMVVVVVTALTPEQIAAEGGLPDGVELMHKPIDMGWLKGYLNALINMGQMAKRQEDMVRMREF